MTRIGVLGSGRLGTALAQGWAEAGHAVLIGSRHPTRGAQERDAGKSRQGPVVPVVSAADAVADAHVVVNATPGSTSLTYLTAGPDGWLDGRVLLDVSNADDDRGNLTYTDGSLAERLQDAFPHAWVVKALNTLNRSVMVNPTLLPESTSVFVSADDPDAKRLVVSLLHDLGWPASQIIDLGPLATARATEHMIAMYHTLRDALGTRDFNYRIVVAPADSSANPTVNPTAGQFADLPAEGVR